MNIMSLDLDPFELMVQEQSYPGSHWWMNAPGPTTAYVHAEQTSLADVNMQTKWAIPAKYQSLPSAAQQVQYPTWAFGNNVDHLDDLAPTMRPGREDVHLDQSNLDSSMSSGNLAEHLCSRRSCNESPVHQKEGPKFPGCLECKWQSCTYRGSFKTEASLVRHVKHMHISPRSFKCPYCDASKGRKDSLMSHIRSVHPDQVQG